VAFIVQKL